MSTTASSRISNKKAQIRIDFDDEIDLKKHFTTGRVLLFLSFLFFITTLNYFKWVQIIVLNYLSWQHSFKK